MNEVFRVDKDRVNKMFYGIDSINAYTKKDFKNLKGSTELRRQVRLPKAHLGFCIPLAMESNGTIFSAKKLELTRKNAVKKFVTVFTRRVAMTAVPCQCQKCECTADNDGMSYMECFPCQYPTPGFYNKTEERKKMSPLYIGFFPHFSSFPRLDKSKAEDKIWVEFFNRQTTIDGSYSQLLKLISFIFSIPISKSFAERIFSVMKNQWSDARNRMSMDLLANALVVLSSTAEDGKIEVQISVGIVNSQIIKQYTVEQRVFIVRTYWKIVSIKAYQRQFKEQVGPSISLPTKLGAKWPDPVPSLLVLALNSLSLVCTRPDFHQVTKIPGTQLGDEIRIEMICLDLKVPSGTVVRPPGYEPRDPEFDSRLVQWVFFPKGELSQWSPGSG
uniref:HAT C-terminal dimerisation domain-containing protein n=1 Tax=Timema genevievae TaxID=629358 RepID=A0A7R9JMZ7_TIMGE|nr:unnamed protein product [Timema genevievae]